MLSAHNMLHPQPPIKPPDPNLPRRIPSSALTHHPYLIPPPSSQPTPSLASSTPPARPSSSQSPQRAITPRPTGFETIRSATAQARRLPASTIQYLPSPASQSRLRSDSVPLAIAAGLRDARTSSPFVQYDMPPPPSSQPRSAADIMMQDVQNRTPWGKRILDAVDVLTQRYEASKSVCNTLSSDQKVMRDQLHALQTTMKGIPSTEDIREEMSSQLPSLVDTAVQTAIQPILDKLGNLPAPTTGVDGSLVKSIHAEVRQAQDAIIKALRPRSPSPARSPSSTAAEQPILALMTHLITVLKPLQDLTSSIEALRAVQGAIPTLKDLEPAFQDMILFTEAMRKINDKVPYIVPAQIDNSDLSSHPVNDVVLVDSHTGLPPASVDPPNPDGSEIKRLNHRLDGIQDTLETILRKLDNASTPVHPSHSPHGGRSNTVRPQEAPLPDAGQITPKHASASTRGHLPTPTSRPQAKTLYAGAGDDLGDFDSDSYSPPNLGLDVSGDIQATISTPAEIGPSPPGKAETPSPRSDCAEGRSQKRKNPQQDSGRKRAKKRTPPARYDGPVTRSHSREKPSTAGRGAQAQEVIVISDESDAPLSCDHTDATSALQPRFVDPPSARTRRNTKSDEAQSASQSQTPSYNTKRKPRSVAPHAAKPKEEQTGTTTSDSSSDDSRASDYGETQRKATQMAKSKASKAKKRVIPASAAILSPVASGGLKVVDASSQAAKAGPEDLVQMARQLTVPNSSFTFTSPVGKIAKARATNKATATPARRVGNAQPARSVTSAQPSAGNKGHQPGPVLAGISRHATALRDIHSQAGPSRFGSLMTETLQTQNSAGGQPLFATKSTLQGDSQVSEVYESMPETSASQQPYSFGDGPSGLYGSRPLRTPLFTYGSAAQRQEQGRKSEIRTPAASDESA